MKTKIPFPLFLLHFFVLFAKAQDFPPKIQIEPEPQIIEKTTAGPDPNYNVIMPRLKIDSCENAKNPHNCSQGYLLRYIQLNINSTCGRCTGTIVISFEVDEFGKIQNEKIARKLCHGLDEEVLRVFRKMKTTFGNWIPAVKNGKPVKVKMSFPIRFR